MAALAGYDYDTDMAIFAIDDADELSELPTTTSIGAGGLVSHPIKVGVAWTTDGSGETYTLHVSSNTWKKRGE